MSGPSDGWRDYLRRLAHGVRRLALAHPQVFPLVATRPPSAPWVRPPLRSLRWVESFLETCWLGRGFSAAVAAYRAFSSFLLGHLLLEVSALGVDTGPTEQAVTGPAADTYTDLSQYPNLQPPATGTAAVPRPCGRRVRGVAGVPARPARRLIPTRRFRVAPVRYP